MIANAAVQIMIPERFDKAVKMIRNALAEWELSVVGEIETTGDFEREAGNNAERSKILLVDCPLTVFEAQVLDRAAGVFLLLHVLVSGRGDQTLVSTMSSAGLFDARLLLALPDLWSGCRLASPWRLNRCWPEPVRARKEERNNEPGWLTVRRALF